MAPDWAAIRQAYSRRVARRLRSLGHGHAPLGAIRGQLDVDDLPGRSDAGQERLARAGRLGLGPMHGLVRVELRAQQCVAHVFAQQGDRPASFAAGDAEEIVGPGRALRRGGGRQNGERQESDGNGRPANASSRSDPPPSGPDRARGPTRSCSG